MRFITTTLFAMCLLCFISCEDETGAGISATTNVALQFVATYDNSPLVMDEVYAYEQDFKVSFSEFRFFISYLSLVEEESNSTLISEIQLIDFSETNQHPVTALDGVQLNFSHIPVGNYTGIKMGIGVIADLNRTHPDEYGDSHPLNAASNYRPNEESYVFTKICGKADLNGDNVFNHSLIYETISDPIYREGIVVDGDFELLEATLGEIKLDIDLKKLFVRNTDDYLNIQSDNIVYDDPQVMTYIANNFQNAITLK